MGVLNSCFQNPSESSAINFRIVKVGKKIFFCFVKYWYMGKIGKQDALPGKSLGNPLNMLKNYVRGQKIRHGR